jgi:hypothetical protein
MARYIRSLLIVAIVFGQACKGPAAPSELPTGTWGGDHISMTVTQAFTHVEFDCAHADIPLPIQLDMVNRFQVSGTFVREHGGPIRLGEVPDSHPALFSGSIAEATMTLGIRLTDPNETIGSYVLTRGATGRVFKCL